MQKLRHRFKNELALSVVSLIGCAQSVPVDVSLSGLPADCTEINLQANVTSEIGPETLAPPEISGQPTSIRFWLPSGAHGPLDVYVQAVRENGCSGTQGTGSFADVTDESYVQLGVTLKDTSSVPCPAPPDPCAKTWCPVTAPSVTTDLNTIWGLAPNQVWAAGSGGTILFFNGTTWSIEASGVPNSSASLNALWGDDVTNLWAVGTGGTALQRSTTGTTWTTAGLVPSAPTLYAVSGVAGSLFAGGYSGTWIHSGSSWVADYASSFQIVGAYAAAPNDRWAIVGGAAPAAMHYSGGPATWKQEVIPGFSGGLYAAVGNGTTDVWVMGDHRFYHYTGSFTTVPWSLTNLTISGLWMGTISGSPRLFGVGASGVGQGAIVDFTPLTSSSPGLPVVVTPNGAPTFKAVWFAPNGEGWAVGAQTTIYHYKP